MTIMDFIPHFIRPWGALALPFGMLLLFYFQKHQRKKTNIIWKKEQENLLSLDNQPIVFKQSFPFKSRSYLTYLLFILTLSFCMAGPAWKKEFIGSGNSETLLVMDMSLQQDRKNTLFKMLMHSLSTLPTGLIVYAGSAHVVSPLTFDKQTLESLFHATSETIMPLKGNRPELAIKKAVSLIEKHHTRHGQIILVTDTMTQASRHAIDHLMRSKPIRLHVIDASRKSNSNFLKNLARERGGKYIPVTDHILNPSLGLLSGHEAWVDGSPYVLPIILFCILLMSRRRLGYGCLIITLLGSLCQSEPVTAASASISTSADRHYNQGNKLARNHCFLDALSAYEKALDFMPEHQDALHNRQIILNLLNGSRIKETKKEARQNGSDNSKRDSLSIQSAGSPPDFQTIFLKNRFSKELGNSRYEISRGRLP